MFVGRERFATILLMRLTETIILWLSDDQSFWEEIEEGPRPLGPFGLQQVILVGLFLIPFQNNLNIKNGVNFKQQIPEFTFPDNLQFYLDMEFVILFSSQGRYLSRNLHQVIKNIIGRAIEAVAANNIDPYR